MGCAPKADLSEFLDVDISRDSFHVFSQALFNWAKLSNNYRPSLCEGATSLRFQSLTPYTLISIQSF